MSIGFSVCQTSGEKLRTSAQPKKPIVKISSPASQRRTGVVRSAALRAPV